MVYTFLSLGPGHQKTRSHAAPGQTSTDVDWKMFRCLTRQLLCGAAQGGDRLAPLLHASEYDSGPPPSVQVEMWLGGRHHRFPTYPCARM